jgi:ABC-type glycerol-3-phosphate transport system substrate-binding protein
MRNRSLFVVLVALLLALAAGCGGGEDETTPPVGATTAAGETGAADTGAPDTGMGAATGTGAATGSEEVSGTVSAMAVWSGTEQESFQAVIDAFEEKYPNVTVNYTSAGDELPTRLSTAVQGGNPPDVAFVPQPGLMQDFVAQGALKPIDFVEQTIADNFGQSAVDVGTVDGTLYGLLFKAANKSTVWANVHVLEDAGVSPPETWDELLQAAQTIKASGVPAYSIAGADGWTLTDLFENIYIRTAGPEMYDQLATHDIPWTDESVKKALQLMGDILGDPDNIAGGVQGALQTEFPGSVTQAFKDNPDAGMVIEGDFVAGEILNSTKAKFEEDFTVFPFPSIEGSPPVVVGGGDLAVMFDDTPATRAFMEFLTTAEAAQQWAERGGFSTLNKNLDPSVYPDEITRETASDLAEAQSFRYDLSDLQPASFGATVGQGMWKIFQDFLQNPDDVDVTAQKLEQAAARAYGSQ